MLALHMTQVKAFMSHLLVLDTFDEFSLVESYIRQDAGFLVDGRRKDENEETADRSGSAEQNTEAAAAEEYVSYASVRPYCLSLVKGQATPASMRMVLSVPQEKLRQKAIAGLEDINVADVQMLCINIRFRGGQLMVTTGTSLRVFRMDKTIEQTWDAWVRKFFIGKGIDFQEV